MSVYRKIGEYYELIREKNENEHLRRMELVKEKIPEITDLDKEISSLGISASLMSLEGKDVKDYKLRISELSDLKKDLLIKNGFSFDFLDPIYSCSDCKDTGVLPNGKRCHCFNKKGVSILYENSNLSYSLLKENFETFDLNRFSPDEYIPSLPSPRENMEMILGFAWDFIKNFDDKNVMSLFFYGPTGQGKTFLLNAIAKELLDMSYAVVYQTSWQLFDLLESRRFRREEYDDMKFKALISCDLLIVDDLGSEFSSKLGASELFNIINSRLLSGKKCLFSSNLDPQELAETYSDRVFSRVFEKFVPIRFYGKDLRWE